MATLTWLPVEPPPPVTDPYLWYPALDLARIPPHTASGAWGAQQAIEAPAAPVITTTSNAATAAELETAMGVSGRRVTITADIIGVNIIDPATVTDVEVIIPNGILLNGVVFGSGSAGNNTVWTRVRFTKASGDTIGGQIQQFRMLGASASDIVIDGLQISGNGEPAIYPGFTDGGVNRIAIVNNRMNSGTANFGYGARHMVVAGNSCNHNAVGATGPVDAWGFRQGGGDLTNGPYIYFQNDMRGPTFYQARFHPSLTNAGLPYYFWAAENTLVDRVGGAMFGAGDLPGTTSSPDISAIWYLENDMYMNGSIQQSGQRTDSSPITEYWRIVDNNVKGIASGLSTWGASDSVNTNTYDAAPGTDPPWGAAGDPTGIDYNP